jgi:hypothetical protein
LKTNEALLDLAVLVPGPEDHQAVVLDHLQHLLPQESVLWQARSCLIAPSQDHDPVLLLVDAEIAQIHTTAEARPQDVVTRTVISEARV